MDNIVYKSIKELKPYKKNAKKHSKEQIEQIANSSNKNDVVLDCYSGSGSTGVACIETGRRFIGIELDEHYFDVSCRRIEEAHKQKKNKIMVNGKK